MTRRDKILGISISLLARLVATPAMAAEAYLCGPDNVVYVEIENLEAMKRSDPCIASYYGLKVQPKHTGAATPVDTAQAITLQDIANQLRPRLVADRAALRSAKASKVSVVRSVVAADGTDYRNVRVINATSANTKWFRHLK